MTTNTTRFRVGAWRAAFCLGLAALLAAPLTASAGEGDPISRGQYKYSMRISFDGYSGGALTDFPVLVLLSTSLTGFDYAQFKVAEGGDLRFADSASRELAYEIEEWNTGGTSAIWVKVSSFTSGGYIDALWGNAGNSAPAYRTDGSTWDANYVGVWHMTEPNAQDSSGLSNHGTDSTSTTTGGLASNAQDFDGNDSLRINAVLDDFSGSTLTVSLMYNTTAARGGGSGDTLFGVFATDYGTDQKFRLAVGHTGTDAGEPCTVEEIRSFGSINETLTGRAGAGTTVIDGSWHQVGFVRTGSAGTLYMDGAAKDTPTAGTALQVLFNDWTIGSSSYYTTPGDFADGILDEVRISKSARSAGWMDATYKVMTQNGTILSYAAVEVAAELGTIFFGW